MDTLDLLKNPAAELADDVALISQPCAKPAAQKNKGKTNTKPTGGRFKITDKGVFLVTPSKDEGEPDKMEFICAKLDVVAMVRDPQSGQWGKLLQWQDPDGQFHEWAMPMAALQGDGAEVRRELAAGGLQIAQHIRLRSALIE